MTTDGDGVIAAGSPQAASRVTVWVSLWARGVAMAEFDGPGTIGVHCR